MILSFMLNPMGKTTLAYTTKYSEKRKSLSLIVERANSVVVLAPTGTNVVIHELAYLVELNYYERFWNLVKVQMPNYMEVDFIMKPTPLRYLLHVVPLSQDKKQRYYPQ